jgi:nucleotide-binding universal stress UspA family protein
MKKILVCLDTSPRAPRVLAAAIDLARRTGAKLTLFRTIGLTPELAHDILGESVDAISQKLVDRAMDALLRYREDVPTELLDAVEVAVGAPWASICHKAQTIDADLVMVGSHGYNVVERALGTTAAKVADAAPCSVLVVR